MRFATTALALALAAQPAAVLAQAKKAAPAKSAAAKPAAAKPAAKASVPTTEQMKAATDTLSLLVSAFNSKDIPAETKDGLLLCLYGNPLGKLARGLDEAIASDPKIDGKSPTQRLLVLAALCDAPVPRGNAKAEEPAKPAEPVDQPPKSSGDK